MIITAFLIVFSTFAFLKSIKKPKPATMQVIMFLNKPYTVISNIEGKRINTDNRHFSFDSSKPKWDLIDLKNGEEERKFNIYFYPWPFFRTYKYSLEYPKRRKIGEEKPGDVVTWKDEAAKECVVSRSGISDHVKFRVEYPTITPKLDTEEMATINVLTDNILEAVNAMKMLFEVDNYLGVATRSIHGTLRGLIGTKKLAELNSIQSKSKDEFNDTMQTVNGVPNHPGIAEFGILLFKSVFNDFEPVNEAAIALMASITNVVIAEEQGKAAIAKQEGETKAFLNKTTAEIDMYVKKTDVEISQEKKRKIQTGVAKANAKGDIISLVPDPNVKANAAALSKLVNLQTYIPGEGADVNKTLIVNPTQK